MTIIKHRLPVLHTLCVYVSLEKSSAGVNNETLSQKSFLLTREKKKRESLTAGADPAAAKTIFSR
jgi:hypothetical protein